MKTDHIIAHSGNLKLECLHCGKTYQAALPCPVSMWTAQAREFVKLHRGCKVAKKRGKAE